MVRVAILLPFWSEKVGVPGIRQVQVLYAVCRIQRSKHGLIWINSRAEEFPENQNEMSLKPTIHSSKKFILCTTLTCKHRAGTSGIKTSWRHALLMRIPCTFHANFMHIHRVGHLPISVQAAWSLHGICMAYKWWKHLASAPSNTVFLSRWNSCHWKQSFQLAIF